MARLKSNGEVVGTIEGIHGSKRYMSNRVILKNTGHGWKKYGRLSPDIDPRTAFAEAVAKQNKMLEQRPAYAAFRNAIHRACGLSKRWRLYSAIQLMPDDADGVWSEACDGYDAVHLDLDEVVELCRLYKAAMKENSEVDAAA